MPTPDSSDFFQSVVTTQVAKAREAGCSDADLLHADGESQETLDSLHARAEAAEALRDRIQQIAELTADPLSQDTQR